LRQKQQNTGNLAIYSATITAGSLLIHESRKTSSLLISGLSRQDIKKKVIEENLFQSRSQGASERHCRLILDRLTLMNPEILPMISEGDYVLSTQALLACAIKHSRLLGDFMLNVIGAKIRIIDDRLSNRDWERFLETCEQVDPHVKEFTESTRKKLKQIIFRILVEAKYLESQKTPRLIPVRVEPELRSFLIKYEEKYVLNCLEVGK
jgi:hypothetical protein